MKKVIFWVFMILVSIALLFFMSTVSYNLFHILIEFSTVMIGFTVYLIAVIALKNESNSDIRHFGIGLVTVSAMTILHALTYKGMNIIPGYDSNLPTQLWICSNIILVLNFITVILSAGKNIKQWKFYTAIAALGVILTITCFIRVFPDCYIEGIGITNFKVIMEYIIIAVYIFSLGYLLFNKRVLQKNTKATFISAVILLATSGFTFTLYGDVYGILNFTGHYLRLIAFVILLLYAIKVNINNPYMDLINNLKESELRFRSMFENTNSIMLLIDPRDGQIVLANPSASDFYGWSVNELTSMNIKQINILPDSRISKEMGVAHTHQRSVFNFRHKLASGKIKDVIVHSSPVNIEGKELLYSIIIDNTSRLLAEKMLAQSENNFKLMFLDAPLPYQSLNEDGCFIKVNKAWLELFGYIENDVIGKRFIDFVVINKKESFEEFFNKFKQNGSISFELNMIKKSNDILTLTFTGRIGQNKDESFRQAHCILQDITFQKKLEKEREEAQRVMTQSQRLESIGLLAGGVAHEINNPINGIMNYGQIIMDSTNKSSDIYNYASEIINETNRVAMIVRNLLDFSRQNDTPHKYANPKDIIDQTILLAKTLIKRDQITLNVEIEENLPDILCTSQHIQQVLMNLISNAKDALNEKYQGYDENKVIKVLAVNISNKSERYIRIIVEDFGTGISNKHKSKIFEPFYTTKDRFKGTGLGLSISHGIIKDHNGILSFDSEPGKYTRFMIDIPAAKSNQD